MKPGIPKGTRDFSPAEMVKRNFIFDTIKKYYQRYGYAQIETPAMENLSTLEGKYGEEGDKLLFRILNSGPVLNAVQEKNGQIKMNDLTEKGLRYDLTVPFARYVVMHQNDITFPFKRFQIQPVWRADRPQKGRYREFYQCDADVIGSTSLLNEAELVLLMQDIFAALNIEVDILINNRKILSGIAEVTGESEKLVDITVAIDKLDKIGIEKVNEEMLQKGVSKNAIDMMQPVIHTQGSNQEKILALSGFLATSSIGMKGIEELETVFDYLNGTDKNVKVDITLARGLNYYTGAIFEVKVNDSRSTFTSSICGGGRYDDLTGIFGLPNMSGVGVSFGVDRIYDVMDEMKMFESRSLHQANTNILFVNFGKAEEKYCLAQVVRLRKEGISAEVFPDAAKMKKQMSYADENKIPFVALVGEDEMKGNYITLKNMKTGTQEKVSPENLVQIIK